MCMSVLYCDGYFRYINIKQFVGITLLSGKVEVEYSNKMTRKSTNQPSGENQWGEVMEILRCVWKSPHRSAQMFSSDTFFLSVEIDSSCNLAGPHRFWVQLHCRKYRPQVWDILSDLMSVLTINKTHYNVKCWNLQFCSVTLWSNPLTEVAECRNKWRGQLYLNSIIQMQSNSKGLYRDLNTLKIRLM